MTIFTHRGLEPTKTNFFSESSFEAFQDHLSRGFGIEFDPNFIKDNHIVIAHDATLNRITREGDTRSFKELDPAEVKQIRLGNGRLCFFEELIDLIRKSKSRIHALHFKGTYQEEPYITTLLKHIETYANDVIDRLLVFDVRPDIARRMKDKISKLHLAPSVAHPFDIKRYNSAVKNTLLSLEEALQCRDEGLYDWVWLDEWDLADQDGGTKKFYSQETFNTLRKVGYKIALVTPELHGTSPGLLGGEAHPDAQPRERFFKRMKEIIALSPDAMCTDYPEEATQF